LNYVCGTNDLDDCLHHPKRARDFTSWKKGLFDAASWKSWSGNQSDQDKSPL
jgi:hypothetical protein